MSESNKPILSVRPGESIKSLVKRTRSKLKDQDLEGFNHMLSGANMENESQVIDVITCFVELKEVKVTSVSNQGSQS